MEIKKVSCYNASDIEFIRIAVKGTSKSHEFMMAKNTERVFPYMRRMPAQLLDYTMRYGASIVIRGEKLIFDNA